ncbi:DUF6778 family protein [Gemmobacter sp. 24YEA27]|uniref:DUF6778 family protein n=1 Tax=Gemmobacter sp. 24YEA27 TaxID=3040672 RepID=UPI0024B34784|nr:DUF6778 family protein [Gemmobacter sp. 24YEA27]
MSLPIKADIAALVGQDAAGADARGFTQKVRITKHLGMVFHNWLGRFGEDPRNRLGHLCR